jgi:hypothetical protein
MREKDPQGMTRKTSYLFYEGDRSQGSEEEEVSPVLTALKGMRKMRAVTYPVRVTSPKGLTRKRSHLSCEGDRS